MYIIYIYYSMPEPAFYPVQGTGTAVSLANTGIEPAKWGFDAAFKD
jgi:hypothetical protein